MDCEKCKTPSVPYIVHEAAQARLERINRRLAIVAALEAVALVLVAVILH